MDEEVAGLDDWGIMGVFVAVIPVEWLIDDMVDILFLVEDPLHGILFSVAAEFDVFSQRRKSGNVSKHFYTPCVDSDKEDTAVPSIPVFGADEVDVAEVFGWWEEGFPGDVGVEEDCVGVDPSARAN